MMLALQLVLTKYCQIGSLVFISLLPAMILCLPTDQSTITNMFIALGCGLCVDFLSDGVWGLNTSALIPVAFMQKAIIRLMIGNELVDRGYAFSYAANGFMKIFMSLLISTLFYMSIYVTLDCVGADDWHFIVRRTLCSTAVSMVFGLVAVNILCPKQQR